MIVSLTGMDDDINALVAPFRWMHFVSLYRPMIGVYTSELDVFTKIVSTILAEETFPTGNTGLNCHPIAWL